MLQSRWQDLLWRESWWCCCFLILGSSARKWLVGFSFISYKIVGRHCESGHMVRRKPDLFYVVYHTWPDDNSLVLVALTVLGILLTMFGLCGWEIGALPSHDLSLYTCMCTQTCDLQDFCIKYFLFCVKMAGKTFHVEIFAVITIENSLDKTFRFFQ